MLNNLEGYQYQNNMLNKNMPMKIIQFAQKYSEAENHTNVIQRKHLRVCQNHNNKQFRI